MSPAGCHSEAVPGAARAADSHVQPPSLCGHAASWRNHHRLRGALQVGSDMLPVCHEVNLACPKALGPSVTHAEDRSSFGFVQNRKQKLDWKRRLKTEPLSCSCPLVCLAYFAKVCWSFVKTCFWFSRAFCDALNRPDESVRKLFPGAAWCRFSAARK